MLMSFHGPLLSDRADSAMCSHIRANTPPNVELEADGSDRSEVWKTPPERMHGYGTPGKLNVTSQARTPTPLSDCPRSTVFDHGPTFGVVFGDVGGGGAGCLTYGSDGRYDDQRSSPSGLADKRTAGLASPCSMRVPPPTPQCETNLGSWSGGQEAENVSQRQQTYFLPQSDTFGINLPVDGMCQSSEESDRSLRSQTPDDMKADQALAASRPAWTQKQQQSSFPLRLAASLMHASSFERRPDESTSRPGVAVDSGR